MDFYQIIETFNWQTIIAMFAIGWYFTREIRSTLQKLEDDVRQQGNRTDKLYEMFLTVQNEIKELHGRTCVVEERNKGS